MDTPDKFFCTVVHPGLFPAPITDPFNPLRVKLVVEVGKDGLSFLSSPVNGQPKVLGSEPIGQIVGDTPCHLSPNKQRLEVFQRSLLRMGMVMAMFFLYGLFFRPYGPFYAFLLGLAGAFLSGPLFFIFNGGLSAREEIIRFQFHPVKTGRSFYLDVEPALESVFRQALNSAGIKFVDGNSGEEEVWECVDCGATIDASATSCPNCGATFDE